MKKIVLLFFILTTFNIQHSSLSAQDWMNVHRHYDGVDFCFPVSTNQVLRVENKKSAQEWRLFYEDADGMEQFLPYSTSYLDSITVSADLTDEEKGHNPARVFTMNITTLDGETIYDRENWVDCFITIDGKGEYSNYSGTAHIKGRGNSSWLWYDKKPYKFKLDSKSKILGLDKAKNWNLLANFRDVTKLMNIHAFETARYMGMPHTCHSRSLEVFLNGEYIGLYELTEKIEVNKNRVDIDEDEGVLLSLDEDDGPELSPWSGDNFWSSVYGLPVTVKYPEDLSEEELESIKDDFAVLEKAIKARNYSLVDQMMDLPSFIHIIQLHEYLYNVEIDAPRSIYLYRDKGGKYTFGPVWDWDAGYDFSWANMYTGHTYFSNYKELILGTDPYNNWGASYSISRFWLDMFGDRQFMSQYKDEWNALSDSIFIKPWATTEAYYNGMVADGYDRDAAMWPTGKTVTKEVAKMKTWLQNRLTYLDDVIAGYPDGEDNTPKTYTVKGTINKTVDCQFYKGYSQDDIINVSKTDVEYLLGGAPTSLVPLNLDGTEGTNTANGMYGAWFAADGNVSVWQTSHVYIESDSYYYLDYGCHPQNCGKGDTHTITMQYRRGSNAVNLSVTFNIN